MQTIINELYKTNLKFRTTNNTIELLNDRFVPIATIRPVIDKTSKITLDNKNNEITLQLHNKTLNIKDGQIIEHLTNNHKLQDYLIAKGEIEGEIND